MGSLHFCAMWLGNSFPTFEGKYLLFLQGCQLINGLVTLKLKALLFSKRWETFTHPHGATPHKTWLVSRGLCDRPITHPGEPYWVWVCHCVNTCNNKRLHLHWLGRKRLDLEKSFSTVISSGQCGTLPALLAVSFVVVIFLSRAYYTSDQRMAVVWAACRGAEAESLNGLCWETT
jgi:hypothetical protein